MRSLLAPVTLAALAIVLVAGAVRSRRAPSPLPVSAAAAPIVDRNQPLYDPNPEHLWNQLDRLFRLRSGSDGRLRGADSLDPLLWRETRYLLDGESHRRALELLDRFLATNAHTTIPDRVKRVLFQRDLWAVFDWAVSTSHRDADARHALASRLARVIRRIALSEKESTGIAMKPWLRERIFDTYAAVVTAGRFPAAYDFSNRARPFLPTGLFDASGPWVPVHGSAPLPQHADEMSRSHFGVFLSLPGGRSATLNYLKKLWDSAEPFAVDHSVPGELRTTLSPHLRPLPPGTQIALVRKMLIIDTAGEILFTDILESIQLRVFRDRIRPTPAEHIFGGHHDQDFYEFVLDRHGLLTNPSTALRAVADSDEDFVTFSAMGVDPFERNEAPRPRSPVKGCVSCHHEEGLGSVLSSRRLFRPYTFVTVPRPVLDGNAAMWKSWRADWGRLQAYWHLETQ